jgi:hypothetical protein
MEWEVYGETEEVVSSLFWLMGSVFGGILCRPCGRRRDEHPDVRTGGRTHVDIDERR